MIFFKMLPLAVLNPLLKEEFDCIKISVVFHKTAVFVRKTAVFLRKKFASFMAHFSLTPF